MASLPCGDDVETPRDRQCTRTSVVTNIERSYILFAMARLRIAAYAIALTFALAGCHGAGTSPVQPTGNLPSSKPRIPQPAPSVVGAEKAAQRAFDALAAGNYAEAWQLYTDAGRAAISQADFVRLNTACPGPRPLIASVDMASGRMVAPDKALIVATVAGVTATYAMDYQAGALVHRAEPATADLICRGC
jgi:hypothetical protein